MFLCAVRCFRVTFESVLLLHKRVNSGILKMKKDNRPQGGLPDYMKKKTCPIARSKSWGGFSMRRLLFVVAEKRE